MGGSLGDRFGRRRIFVVGLVRFAAASLACGLAPDTAALIAARALQGVGAALLAPGSTRARDAAPLAVAALQLQIVVGYPALFRSGVAFDASFRRAMPLCAGLLAAGASVAFGTLRRTVTASDTPHGRTHGRLMEPPLVSRFTHRQAVE